MRTWIKFCGTTSLDDALASIEAGADALGFIFAPSSKRRVTVEQARKITSKLPPHVEKIGVVMKYTPGQLRKTVTELGLTGVQLYGPGSTTKVHKYFCTHHHAPLRIIKVTIMREALARQSNSVLSLASEKVIVGRLFPMRPDSSLLAGELDAWLLDSGTGSGKTFDWQAVRKQLGEWQGRLIIAGGLTPENVGEAIRIFSPWGVDVVSGIEREPGRKDPEKMRAFVAAVRKAEEK